MGVNSKRKSDEWKFNYQNTNQGIVRNLGRGLTTRIFVGDRSMLSFVTIEPHTQGNIHHHPEEQWGVLLHGTCFRIQDGEEVEMSEGDFWYTPSNVPHGVRTEESPATILDIFSPPRPEYKIQETDRE